MSIEIDKLWRISQPSGDLMPVGIVSVEATDYLKSAGNCLTDSLIQLRILAKVSLEANQKDNVEDSSCVPLISASEIDEVSNVIDTSIRQLLTACDSCDSSVSADIFGVRCAICSVIT